MRSRAPVEEESQQKWNAKLFDEQSSPQARAAVKIFNEQFDLYRFEAAVNLDQKLKLCDVGCGPANFLQAVSQLYPDIELFGFDKSPEMVRLCHQKGFENIIEMDAAANSFVNKFHVVTSFFALQLLEDVDAAVEGIKNSLLPGGQTIHIIPLRHNELWDSIEEAATLPQWVDKFVGYVNPRKFRSLDTYVESFEKAGFAVHNSKLEIGNGSFSRDSLITFIQSWLQHLNRLDESEHEAFLNDIVDIIECKVECVAEEFQVPFHSLELCACRPRLDNNLSILSSSTSRGGAEVVTTTTTTVLGNGSSSS